MGGVILIKTTKRRCIICKSRFIYSLGSAKKWCDSESCIDEVADRAVKKAADDAFAIRKKKFQETDPKHLKRLKAACQSAFNAMIRALDKDEPCISCNRSDSEIKEKARGGKWDCGHYKTRGAYPEYCFEPSNAYKQCKGCNSGSYHHASKADTVMAGFILGIKMKMGQEVLDWLDVHRAVPKHSADDYKRMAKEYRAEAGRLLKGLPPSKVWRRV